MYQINYTCGECARPFKVPSTVPMIARRCPHCDWYVNPYKGLVGKPGKK